jgi:hypothetical protein
LRYAVSLLLLIAVIGGIAWVVQYLPSLSKKTPPPPPPPPAAKLLEFPRWIAQWDNRKPEEKPEVAAQETYLPKTVEFGKEGHYDFPFKNISGQEVEVVQFVSDCDCTSVRVCSVPMAEWTRIAEQQKLRPGEPIAYPTEPAWQDLQTNRQQTAEPHKATVLKVKADEGGVVRIRWTVKKTPGQTLKLNPHIAIRQAGAQGIQWQTLAVPVLVGTAICFEPSRVHVGLLAPGSKPVTAEFDAWSSTREKFDLKLTPLPANPFFHVETRPLSDKECGDLASNLKSDKSPVRVLSGHHVTVTVYETKDGKQLDQGPFYQKLAIDLDGYPERELPGPEIVGRVQGDIRIGGADDQGKVRFKSFPAGETALKTVELLADAKVQLEPYTHEPPWLEVKVTRNKDQPDPKQHGWRLQVTVPANTPGVRSFEETDHVTLRIVGTPDRFVRIAIEGHVSGR